MTKVHFQILALIFFAPVVISYFAFNAWSSMSVLLLLLAFLALSWSWTYTDYGRLDYLAAVSLRLLSFNVPFKPDPEMDFRLKLPLNLLFVVEPVLPKAKIQRQENIEISQGDLQVPAIVYWPDNSDDTEATRPLILYYHGGGFAVGTAKAFEPLARSIAAQTGAVVVSVDYRLAPRHPFPAAVDDAYAALLWASENASKLGADAGKILVSGDSAGGNLAAVVAMKARDHNGPQVAGQILYYPATEWASGPDWPAGLQFTDGYGLNADSLKGFRDAYCGHLQETVTPEISPNVAERFDDLPPVLLVTAGFDPLTEGAKVYAGRLEDAGVTVTHAHYPEMIHGFLGVSLFSQRRDALRQTGQFVRSICD